MIPPDVKKYLNLHIKAQFDNDPEITARQVKKWLLTGNQPVDLSAIKKDTLSHFISYQLQKLKNAGSPSQQASPEEGHHQVVERD